MTKFIQVWVTQAFLNKGLYGRAKMKEERVIKWQSPGSDVIHTIPEVAKVWFETKREYAEISFVEDAEGTPTIFIEAEDL